MEQFGQLLTCAICLDRYRNPKLLPCQHSFCMEPCMDGLVDYVKRQLKCPECRAEHRIPYNGVQGFPTNATMQSFLELHIEITGDVPDPTTGQVMERCNICSDKTYCSPCAHCEKKVCDDCKEAHMDVVKKEITRINNQIRRTVTRLEDILPIIVKNTSNLKRNCSSVTKEIDEIYYRLAKVLKDRMEGVKGEITRYLSTEMPKLTTYRDKLKQELETIQGNCDLAEKYMLNENSASEWDDAELMDTKDVLLRTVDFLRNFDYGTNESAKRVRFSVTVDPNELVSTLANYGDMTINTPPQVGGSSVMASLPATASGPGMMRSKSGHHLSTQFRQQQKDADGSGYVSPLMGRRFGERRVNRDQYSAGDDASSSRYGGGGGDYSGSDSENESYGGGRSMRFLDDQHQRRDRDRLMDTEDVTKGPLSGIMRLYDSPRVMKRIRDTELNKDRKKDKESSKPVQHPVTPWNAQRQLSRDDMIAQLKKQQQASTDASVGSKKDDTTVAERFRKQRSLSRQEDEVDSTPFTRQSSSSSTNETAANTTDRPAPPNRWLSANSTAAQAKTYSSTLPDSSVDDTETTGRPQNRVLDRIKPRSNSADSNASTESSTSNHSTGAAFSTGELRQRYLPNIRENQVNGSTKEPERKRSLSSTPSVPSTTGASRSGSSQFQSRFLRRPSATEASKEPESSSGSEETSSESESEDEKKTKVPAKRYEPTSKTDASSYRTRSTDSRDTKPAADVSRRETPSSYKSLYRHTEPSTGSTYDRNNNNSYSNHYGSSRDSARDTSYTSPRDRHYGISRSQTTGISGSTRDNDDDTASRYTNKYLNGTRSSAVSDTPASSSRYRSGGFKSRFLNRR